MPMAIQSGRPSTLTLYPWQWHIPVQHGGVSVDFAYMDKIVQFNKDDMDIVVQPSIGWQDLNAQLLKMGSGLFFPVDPGMLSMWSWGSSDAD